MKTWKNRVILGDLHKSYENGELNTQAVSAEVVKRLKALPIKDDDFFNIIDEFESIATDDSEDSEESYEDWYNNVLESLYDFGDFNKTLWIDTFQ